MGGCQDKAAMAELEEFKAQAALEEQNKEIVKRAHELHSKGDFEARKESLPLGMFFTLHLLHPNLCP
jgi:hypothetical protein